MTTEELDLLYREQFGALYRFVLFKVRHTQTAEDIAQTVFVRALEALPRFKIRDDKRTEAPASAWLFTIARNLCIDHYKKHSSFTPGDETGFFSEIADVRAYAPYASAALLIAFFGFRAFPANGANDNASLDISSLEENIPLAQLSFNE